ncbi:MAG: CPBP family intramembrane metalloprotease [Oscillospiraceae bacterium]|nr:CPBP family intramembrane metalloprotease [Oscillospiraceae bacterium]
MDNEFNEQRNKSYGSIPPPQLGYPKYEPYHQAHPQPNRMTYQQQYELTACERTCLKGSYSHTFIICIIHALGSFILAQVIFTAMMICGYEFRTSDDGTQIVDWMYNLAGSLPSIIFCVGIFMYEAIFQRHHIKKYFLSDGISLGTVVSFFGLTMLAYGIAIIVQNAAISGLFAIGISPIKEEYITETDLTPAFLICEVIVTAIAAPVCEELLFRGVVLRRLSNISQGFGIIMSALIFGLMHGNLVQTILGFILGLVFGYTAVRTGSLILPIAGHIFINATAVSCNFAEYYFGEETSASYWSVVIIMFIILGMIALLWTFASGRIRLPCYTEYHRKRTLPVVVTCVPFWIMTAYYIYSVVSVFGPVTDKLLGE